MKIYLRLLNLAEELGNVVLLAGFLNFNIVSGIVVTVETEEVYRV